MFKILLISPEVFWKNAGGRPFGPRDFVTSIWSTFFWIVRFGIIKFVKIGFSLLISAMLNFCLAVKIDWKNSFNMSTCSLRFVLLMLQLIKIFGKLGDLFRNFKCLKIASVFRVLSSFSWYSFRSCSDKSVTCELVASGNWWASFRAKLFPFSAVSKD